MEKKLVTIKVEGLGTQEVFMDYADAVMVYAAAGQGISEKLIASLGLAEPAPQKSLIEMISEHKPYAIKERVLDTTELIDKDKVVAKLEVKPSYDNLEKTLEKAVDSAKEILKSKLEVLDCGEKQYELGCGENTPKKLDKEDEEFYNKRAEALNSNPFYHEMFKKPKLVAYKCPECGKITVRNLTLGETNETHCHWCKEPITIKAITLAEIACTSCSHHQFLYVTSDVQELSCHTCEAPIDIVFLPGGRKAISANLSHRH